MPASEKYSRNLKTTHIVFALSSFALLAVTVWMMWDDYSTEWRGHQQTVDELNYLKLQAGLDDVTTDGYNAELETLVGQIADADPSRRCRKAQRQSNQQPGGNSNDFNG